MKKPKNRTVERNETKTERETVPKEPTLVGKIVGGSIFGYVNIEKNEDTSMYDVPLQGSKLD